MVSAAVRLSVFTLPEIQDITARDTLELEQLGERKQAIFCVIPDSNDNSLNFLVGMLYTQAFQELYFQADKVHEGSLPVPVRLLFDEFANISLPDGYARLQATMRSRNIMATIILQNISQLKALFKDDWEGIIGNADSFIYLGGNEQSTHKYVSELLGKRPSPPPPTTGAGAGTAAIPRTPSSRAGNCSLPTRCGFWITRTVLSSSGASVR